MKYPSLCERFLKWLTFPLFSKVVCGILRSSSFREMVYREALARHDKGIPTFLDYPGLWGKNWRDYFLAHSFSTLLDLKERLKTGLDETSKEVIERLFLCRLLTQFDEVLPMSQTPFHHSLRAFFPLYYVEQEHLSRLGSSFCPKYKFGELLEVPPIHMASCFGMSYFSNDTLQKLKGRDVIDGGGYAGDSAMVFTELQPSMVYAFEPNPETLGGMKKNIEMNRDILGEAIHRITPVNLALGSGEGTITLYTNGAFDGSTSCHQTVSFRKKREHVVPVTSIDDFVDRNKLDIGLIKLDVEGAESNVIDGAMETIKKCKPILVISIYHTPKDFFEIKPRLDALKLGYRFQIRHLVPGWPLDEYCLLGSVD